MPAFLFDHSLSILPFSNAPRLSLVTRTSARQNKSSNCYFNFLSDKFMSPLHSNFPVYILWCHGFFSLTEKHIVPNMVVLLTAILNQYVVCSFVSLFFPLSLCTSLFWSLKVCFVVFEFRRIFIYRLFLIFPHHPLFFILMCLHYFNAFG